MARRLLHVPFKVRGLESSFCLLSLSLCSVTDASLAFLWFYCPPAHLARSGKGGFYDRGGFDFSPGTFGLCWKVWVTARVCDGLVLFSSEFVQLFPSPFAVLVSLLCLSRGLQPTVDSLHVRLYARVWICTYGNNLCFVVPLLQLKVCFPLEWLK